jgi:hypothetical protein
LWTSPYQIKATAFDGLDDTFWENEKSCFDVFDVAADPSVPGDEDVLEKTLLRRPKKLVRFLCE